MNAIGSLALIQILDIDIKAVQLSLNKIKHCAVTLTTVDLINKYSAIDERYSYAGFLQQLAAQLHKLPGIIDSCDDIINNRDLLAANASVTIGTYSVRSNSV